MRIHTDTVREADLRTAAGVAEVELIKAEPHGSRKRARAYEVALSGSGRMGGMYGNLDYATATWDEWGIFLAALYRIDPEMIAGPYQHNREDDYESFDFLTGERYRDLTPANQHKRHRWEPQGRQLTYCIGLGVVRSFATYECACGAGGARILDYIGADGSVTRKRPARMMGDAR